METIVFPYDPPDHELETSSTLWLSTSTAERLRGRFIWHKNSPGITESDLVNDDGSMRFRGVQLLANGWIRAYTYYEVSVDQTDRIDLLFAPGEIVAVTTSTTVSTAPSDPEYHKEKRQTMNKLLRAEWQRLAPSPVATN